jgi:hypothetical protein
VVGEIGGIGEAKQSCQLPTHLVFRLGLGPSTPDMTGTVNPPFTVPICHPALFHLHLHALPWPLPTTRPTHPVSKPSPAPILAPNKCSSRRLIPLPAAATQQSNNAPTPSHPPIIHPPPTHPPTTHPHSRSPLTASRPRCSGPAPSPSRPPSGSPAAPTRTPPA